ncbi:MAG: DNA-protecting protein DprA [Rhodobacterales bacterium]|nr:DNA-protecting protein DprA [Rhodobacterales bacterium]NCT11949.1 DNA-protecting protein DprA [Rhodobacterales bacterium]
MAEEPTSSTHPPLPPTTEDDRLSWLRLLRSRRVGVATFWRLMGEHGTAQAALRALPDMARASGIADYAPCPEPVVLAEMKAARACGARLLCHGEPAYPADLMDIEDAPPLLWLRGDPGLLGRPMVALVGARNASSLGTRMARALAAELSAAGYVVVSGLARGVDAAAHQAALDGGTVAVLAGGVDVIYPAENAALTHDIARRGLLLSDQPMGLQPQSRHFPARNRIISGLARAVVVVEAAAKSGSLITARTALDQGREVMAVPGHPFDARASGCNMLIRDGAILVRNGADVIELLGTSNLPAPRRVIPAARPPAPARPAPPQPALPRSLRDTAALHRQILDRLSPSPMAEDQLIRDLQTSAHVVAPVLIDLELDGRIRRQSGGLLSRIN